MHFQNKTAVMWKTKKKNSIMVIEEVVDTLTDQSSHLEFTNFDQEWIWAVLGSIKEYIF